MKRNGNKGVTLDDGDLNSVAGGMYVFVKTLMGKP